MNNNILTEVETYRTLKNRIPRKSVLHDYIDKSCAAANNLYNRANFLIRQLYTGLPKAENDRYDNEKEAIDFVTKFLYKVNREREIGKSRGEVFNIAFDGEHNWITYDVMCAILTRANDKAYRAIPSAQMAQQVLKNLYDSWKSFFEANKSYKENPEKFDRKPQIPKYLEKGSRRLVKVTNQDAKVKEHANGTYYLKFPNTKTKYWLGDTSWFPEGGKLSEVRFVPKNDHYVMELVFKLKVASVEVGARVRVAAIDPGLVNFVTLVNNFCETPIIIKGGEIKSENQYFNKVTSVAHELLPQGVYSSRNIRALWDKRKNIIDDYMHKYSKWVIDWCIEHDIDCLVIGKNKKWKSQCDMGHENNQHFCAVPHAWFIEMLRYKGDAAGIEVITGDESYTSKASFLDYDPIPTYGEPGAHDAEFSGTRPKRGLYKSADGTRWNADVNGACNTMVKVIPTAFDSFEARGDSGVVDTPVVVTVSGAGKLNTKNSKSAVGCLREDKTNGASSVPSTRETTTSSATR